MERTKVDRICKRFDSMVPLVFDGTEAQCFEIFLRSVVLFSRMRYIIPGVLYTFIIRQDAIGNHRFLWPRHCRNATPIFPNPNSVTTQTFVGAADGGLDATSASTWEEKP